MNIKATLLKELHNIGLFRGESNGDCFLVIDILTNDLYLHMPVEKVSIQDI